MSLFSGYIGIDYSGAKTPTASLPGLRVYAASRGESPVEAPPPASPRIPCRFLTLTGWKRQRETSTMNKTQGIVFAVVVVVGLALATVGTVWSYKITEGQTIVAVINQNGQAAKDCTVQFATDKKPKPQRAFKTQKFIKELHNIDTSACPKRFQMAWLEYVQAWEREGEITPDRNLVDFLFGVGGVYAKSSSMASRGVEPFEARDAVTQAWQKVERVALEYDVRVVYQPVRHN